MSSHSPHRSRKNQMYSTNSPPRELSPSPRERQRTVKAQSLPIVPSVMQVFNPQRTAQQSPPSSIQPKRSSTPPSKPPGEDHYPANPTMGYPRPINRIAPPFLASFHAMEENWQMTDELMAEIERADYAQTLSQQPAAPGTSGVAYAGGAQSGAVYVREVPSPHKDSLLDRVRQPDSKDVDKRPQLPTDPAQPRNRPLPASPGNSPSYSPQGHPQARGPTPDRLSPPYHTPQGSSGESATAADYVSLKRDSFSSARVPTPPTARKASNTSENTRATPPAASKLASQTPPLQAMKTRTPDKSLPVQEEPEDDVATSSKDDANYDHTPREDDDDTLIETETAYTRPSNDHDRDRDADGGSASYTPRSPSVSLPDAYPARNYANTRLASLTKHHRNGSTDQLGLRSFDAVVNAKPPPARPSEESRESSALFDADPEQTKSNASERSQHRAFSNDAHPTSRAQEQSQSPVHSPQHPSRPHPLQTQIQREDQHYYDDPAAAYLQMYFSSARPNAPIPPTPHSQTAAPSPSPFVSSIGPSPAPHVGSPYPYPFSHVPRNRYSLAVPTAPSTNYDPNHPSVIEEQLALQMQMYALNNNATMTDSTFSPSATPFPGANPGAGGVGYNPWAFLQASRAFGGRRFDSMSLQSSPSHQPVSLPYPSRGRGLKRRERSTNLRTTKRKSTAGPLGVAEPLPRVESTQPRDTSPEPYSSGEETAGEGEYEVHEEPAWVNGQEEEDEEWVDEEGDKDELLELEYHPSFVGNVERRRRRWDSKWEALQQAFQALDCETDTTMVLFAAPSHMTKMHLMTSRSVRRDMLLKSPAMAQMRTAFKGVASRRRATRSRATSSLFQRLLSSSSSTSDGSDTTTSEARETELKRALGAALGSLDSLRMIYEGRVARWEEEMARITDERERVELLLQQTIGVGLPSTVVNGV